MRYQSAYLCNIGYELPEERVSTRELEEQIASVYKKLRIPMGQLELLSGIRERRWWPDQYPVSQGATQAALKALKASGLKGSDLDILVYTGVCRDYIEPATACSIANNIDISPTASVYDISNACLGALNGVIDVANRIELGQAKYGMVVSCESARSINNDTIEKLKLHPTMEVFKASLATLTGGSGAVAIILCHKSCVDEARHKLIGGANHAASEHHDLCRWGMKRTENSLFEQFLNTDPVSVMKHGVELGKRTWSAFLKELSWAQEMVDRTICHQVGQSHRKGILHALGLKESHDYPTFHELGNMGSVSLPLSAALAAESGFVKKGDRVGLLGIGSGLNCMMLGVEW